MIGSIHFHVHYQFAMLPPFTDMQKKSNYGSLTEDKDKAGSAKVNKSGHVKTLTVTTSNIIQAGLNSTRRKKAKHWTQNQLTNRMHILLEKYKPLWKCSERFIPPQTEGMVRFYCNIGCSESEVIDSIRILRQSWDE